VDGFDTNRVQACVNPEQSVNGGHDRIMFITVPPPRSGNVVKALRRIPGVVSAAAVYSGIDVVARLSGSDSILQLARDAIDDLGAPITEIEEFFVDQIITGPRFHDSTVLLRSSCRAYIRCTIDINENTIGFAANVLQELDCTVAVYLSRDSAELVLEVLAADKGQFDEVVMSRIQGEWAIVKSTRSFLVINNMSWTDWVDSLGPTIFMSVADDDNAFATTLKRQIEADTGLHCWKYDDDILEGEANWPNSVDGAMRSAPLHLYVLSEHFLKSGECQREFGQSLQLVRHPQDICGLLKSGFDPHRLGDRYRIRNLIVGEKFFAYSKLLDWVHRRLAATGGSLNGVREQGHD
jgi:hypothetical protein